jgi:hypothetical protein
MDKIVDVDDDRIRFGRPTNFEFQNRNDADDAKRVDVVMQNNDITLLKRNRLYQFL